MVIALCEGGPFLVQIPVFAFLARIETRETVWECVWQRIMKTVNTIGLILLTQYKKVTNNFQAF